LTLPTPVKDNVCSMNVSFYLLNRFPLELILDRHPTSMLILFNNPRDLVSLQY